jgi:hypothetical protein
MADTTHIDFFFRPPQDFKGREGQHSTLHLLRREIQECLLDQSPVEEGLLLEQLDAPDEPDEPRPPLRRIIAATILTFAGLDLLATFHAGQGGQRAGPRFKRFARQYLRLNPADAGALWQVRSALVHSFGPYDPQGGRRVLLTTPAPGSRLTARAIRQEAGTWHVSPVAVYRDLVRAIQAYEADVRAGAPAIRANFDRMFPHYGTMAIR